MRVSLFTTCLGDRFFGDACTAALRLLRHLGVEAAVPADQTCCGQPAYNAGHRSEAVRMARHTLRVFGDSEYVVLPSGSCAGMLRGYPALLPEADRSDARALATRTFELSQFLVDVMGLDSVGRGLEGRTLAYHHGCHALRELGVRDQPLTLLRSAGAAIAEWEAAEECCGFGGLFSVKLPAVSAGMADRKLDTLPAVDVVTSADGGCLMQLSGRARRRVPGGGPAFRHVAELLAEAAGLGTVAESSREAR